MTATNLDRKKIVLVQRHLSSKVIGQDQAVNRVAKVLHRGELRLTNPERPKGSFLFLGPTGVGKTELTRVFTEYLFGSAQEHLARLDMSEYQVQNSLSVLLGANNSECGVLGHRLSTGKVKVLLFDEIEKAHPLVLDILLQILDAGRVTDATGKTWDLTDKYIVCTSNIGSGSAMEMTKSDQVTVERTVLQEVDNILRPELVGRFNDRIVFRRLDYEVQRAIGLKIIEDVVARLRETGYLIEVDDNVLEFLVREGIHKRLGARPMRNAVESHIENAVAASLLSDGYGSGKLVVDSALKGLLLT